MKRPDNLERDFNKPDGEMLSQADVFHSCITEDKPRFEDFDSMFNTAYIDNFKVKIDAGYEVKTDDYWIDVVARMTKLFMLKIEEGKSTFFSFEHFADKLEITIPGIKDKLGYNDYEKSRKSQTRFVLLMDTFNDVVIEYNADFVAAGLAQEKIDRLGILAEDIRTAHKDQEKAKKDRKVATKNRVIVLNDIWAIMSEISKVAKIIFADDIAHYERYLLYEGESDSDQDNEDDGQEGDVT